MPRREKKFLN